MEETGKNPIQVAERLFQVIECLAENGPMGIMDLSAQLGFHKSTTHRLVTSLQYMGYIRQDEESLKYALSLKFLEIGGKILEQTNMASLVHPSLKKLSEQTGETVHLVRREGTEAVYIDKVESNVDPDGIESRKPDPPVLLRRRQGAACGAAGSGDQRDLEQLRDRVPDTVHCNKVSGSHGTDRDSAEGRICDG